MGGTCPSLPPQPQSLPLHFTKMLFPWYLLVTPGISTGGSSLLGCCPPFGHFGPWGGCLTLQDVFLQGSVCHVFLEGSF